MSVDPITEKFKRLIAIIQSAKSAAVAFSGGVDSSFLCYAAAQTLGGNALAITIASPMLPKTEIDAARQIAAQLGIAHILLHEDEIDKVVAENPADRCYHCKKIEFGAIQRAAAERGIETVFDGSNVDDEGDYRPGLKALSELKIASPLREAGLHKAEIRELSRRFELPTWDKPAFACLASRIPYGEKISREKLIRIEGAEDILRGAGFVQFRVRSHGDIARIEVAPDERRRFFDEALLDSIAGQIKALGFLYAAFELEGYKMGSLNRALTETSA
ncbi:MAG: ATP-dependent sacrificial sulfur transferase LarE [Spirochaetaceae bacterium]|nr:ATP-dependent sacrificial sulfur transferase LarE [Spirochaetaceae bacterium]